MLTRRTALRDATEVRELRNAARFPYATLFRSIAQDRDLRRRYSRIDRPGDREIERVLVAVVGGKADLAAFRPRAGRVELYRERVRTVGRDRRREPIDQAEARRQH